MWNINITNPEIHIFKHHPALFKQDFHTNKPLFYGAQDLFVDTDNRMSNAKAI